MLCFSLACFKGTVKFQWTIDEIAVLKPADIEEPCLPDAWNLGFATNKLNINERFCFWSN